MAGILASSASKAMVSGETAASDVESGYVTAEQIVLSTTPTGSSYSWGLAIPSGSTVARSGLSSTTAASPTFTPDVVGEYVVTCTVDSTTSYVIRLSVAAIAATSATGALRFLPLLDASVPTPTTGGTLFHSSGSDALSVKAPGGAVSAVNLTAATYPEWASYAVAFSAEGGSPEIGSGSVEALWRKVGDSIEFQVFASFGSSTNYGTGALLFDVLSTIPGGYTFDTTKMLVASLVCGDCRFSDLSPASNGAVGYLSVNGTTQVKMSTLARADVTATVPFTWASGDYIVLRGLVPVQVV